MKNIFRPLRADEVQIRLAYKRQNARGFYGQFLLYQDARAGMTILDDSLGPWNWRRSHKTIGNTVYCTLEVNAAALVNGRDVTPDQYTVWITREDCGSEGKNGMETDKAQASDSFKRACVALGIGRELYTAPKIYIGLAPNEDPNLYVSHIGYDNKIGAINDLEIKDYNGNIRYSYRKPDMQQTAQQRQTQTVSINI